MIILVKKQEGALMNRYGTGEFSSGTYDPQTLSKIEKLYEVEAQLMNEIAHGHTAQAAAILNAFTNDVVEQRASVPLRNYKNYLIVLNTLARKAVQQGGVHPFYIDQISSIFGHKIEAVSTMEEGHLLAAEMNHKYCLLVRNHAMKNYSPLVRRVILRIDSDLTADLSLAAHAAALGVNASYLSALFRRETGMTLSDCVARTRIEHAVFLLNTTPLQIQAVAQRCGIQDVNYFTRLFRRVMGKTPSAYRQQARGEGVTPPGHGAP